MPSWRGITALAPTRRRIGKRPTWPEALAGPGSTAATLTRASGSSSGDCSTRWCSIVTPAAVSCSRSSSYARGMRRPLVSIAKESDSRTTAGCSAGDGSDGGGPEGGGLEGGGTDMAPIVIGASGSRQ